MYILAYMQRTLLRSLYLAFRFQILSPYLPTFRERTEANLSQRKLADDDRKYIIRVLGILAPLHLCLTANYEELQDCRISCTQICLSQRISE